MLGVCKLLLSLRVCGECCTIRSIVILTFGVAFPLPSPSPSARPTAAVYVQAMWMLGGSTKGVLWLWSVRLDKGRCLRAMHLHRGAITALVVPNPEVSVITAGKQKKDNVVNNTCRKSASSMSNRCCRGWKHHSAGNCNWG